ncbi:hypothetical protein D3C78_1499590 [compost metagenome]
MSATGLGRRLIHGFDDLPAAQQEALAGVGQAQAPRGALQQTRLYMFLQIRHQSGYLRGRQIQRIGSPGETGAVHHPDEHAQVVKHIHKPPSGDDCYVLCKAASAVRPFIRRWQRLKFRHQNRHGARQHENVDQLVADRHRHLGHGR